jgi:hypothetical protein
MSDENVTLSRDEFEEIKGQLIYLDAELSRLMAQTFGLRYGCQGRQ